MSCCQRRPLPARDSSTSGCPRPSWCVRPVLAHGNRGRRAFLTRTPTMRANTHAHIHNASTHAHTSTHMHSVLRLRCAAPVAAPACAANCRLRAVHEHGARTVLHTRPFTHVQATRMGARAATALQHLHQRCSPSAGLRCSAPGRPPPRACQSCLPEQALPHSWRPGCAAVHAVPARGGNPVVGPEAAVRA